MSYALIEEGINKIKNVTSWSSLLIEYNHKKKPNEYVCYKMNFETSELLTGTIFEMCKAYLKIVNSYGNKVLDYTGTNPKNVVDKISTTNSLVDTCWKALIESINRCDDTTDLKNIKASAYIFVGTYTNSEGNAQNLYLLTKRNPLLTFKKGRTKIFTSQHNTIKQSADPLVQFNKCFDALIYNNVIYMINSNCESIFNMEHSYKLICNTCLSELETLNIIQDIEDFRSYASNGQTPRKFITYDKDIIEKLKQTKWRIKLAKELKIPLTSDNEKFILSDTKHAKNFTLAICGKTKLNMFDATICEVPSSIPLKL